jgi:ATP-dependent 26S proteasome regulatory subunit
MMRVTGSLLSWLSDNLNPNYIVATCNSLTRMGEIGLTMTRSERFDAAFFMDVPNHSARASILRTLLDGQVPDPARCAEQVAAQTDKFSGADLFAVVKHGMATAAHDGCGLQMQYLLSEVSRKQSRAKALYEEFQPLRAWAAKFCEPAADID